MCRSFDEHACANHLDERAASIKAAMRARLDANGYSAPGVAQEMGVNGSTLRRYLSNTYRGVLPVDLLHAWFRATGGDLSPVRQQLAFCGYGLKRLGGHDEPPKDEVRLTGEIAHQSGEAVALLVRQWADGVRTREERAKALPVLRKMRAHLDQLIEADERLAKPARRA